MHLYSGSVELMREYMKLGFYITLGGATTFKMPEFSRSSKAVPLDRLMLETDVPI